MTIDQFTRGSFPADLLVFSNFNKCVTGYSCWMDIHYYVYHIIKKNAIRPDYKSHTQNLVL
ncbi:BAD_HP_G0050160.mRNA.1.CDS.1 [Saccharomyces cerevisiae]|nr:BAD_HP_G0050160.mRNA.1.CDS.1 [Saccharomyces cerevisiae]CAI6810106.1 BAD_HP_G0050160.mRNA.1.CDS.1 [Saccharomyces cerevisiae]